MMGRTHLLLGLNSLWILEAAAWVKPDLVSFSTLPVAISAVCVGALLPDLDAPHSLLQNVSVGGVRPLVPLGRALNRQLGHRGFLHSLAALGLLALLSAPAIFFLAAFGGWAFCLLLGYASHLVGDACTKTGVPLFFVPGIRPRRAIHLLPPRLRLSTGSAAEEVVFATLGALALLLLLRHLNGFSP